tara:strand:+ start:78 stop:320 length:243 start_codon:yes stop_codon:yes gene_type:complete
MKDTHHTILDPSRKEIQACFLKAALKISKTGMLPSRGMTKTKLMSNASGITGVIYKRGQIDTAIADLTSVIETYKKTGEC